MCHKLCVIQPVLCSFNSSLPNLCRRELIRPDLNVQYKQLCSLQTPISKLLFGDDLWKVVTEDISETNKVSQKVPYRKDGTYSKHGSNALKRQGPYSNRQLTFFVHWPIPEDWSSPRNSERGRQQINKNIQSNSVGKEGEPPYSYINSLCES